jgi:hypothetical protein
MSYITLRGRWLDTIVVNVHATSEDKSRGTKRVFDQFPKYNMNILLGEFNAKAR